MLAPAKRTSAPRSSVFIDARSFSKRSLRNRSKSTRYCQSAPVWLYRRRGSHSCGCPKNLVSIMFKTSFLLDDVKCRSSYSSLCEWRAIGQFNPKFELFTHEPAFHSISQRDGSATKL